MNEKTKKEHEKKRAQRKPFCLFLYSDHAVCMTPLVYKKNRGNAIALPLPSKYFMCTSPIHQHGPEERYLRRPPSESFDSHSPSYSD